MSSASGLIDLAGLSLLQENEHENVQRVFKCQRESGQNYSQEQILTSPNWKRCRAALSTE